ncbi:hypothetical protein BH24ACT5_BH24ACT5_19200 [soil metagenome]
MAEVSFRRVSLPGDAEEIVRLLCGSSWPFHGRSHVSTSEAAGMDVLTDDVDSYWILDHGRPVGLIRLLDLGDVDDGGSPLFDMRIAEPHRRRGIGSVAVAWLTDHLFERFSGLHRIEAATRPDNDGMRGVLDRCGYQLEGRLRESWPNEDGSRTDAMIYGILRREWAPTPSR